VALSKSTAPPKRHKKGIQSTTWLSGSLSLFKKKYNKNSVYRKLTNGGEGRSREPSEKKVQQ